MSFISPVLLLGLVLVPIAIVAYVMYERSRERRAAAWVSPAMTPNLVHRKSPRIRHIPAVLFLIGLTFLLVGFARPKAEITSVREGATIILLVDVSGSMGSPDLTPTRLGAVNDAILKFLPDVPEKYRVGVITFNRTPSIKVLPTYNRTLVEKSLPKETLKSGTQIGGAIQKAVQVAVKAVGADRPGSPHPPAAILLLSDGTQTDKGTPVEAAVARAKRQNVPVSTILIGTPDGTVNQGVFVSGPGSACIKDCTPIPVPTDPTTLQSIAIATGAKYSEALTEEAMRQVYVDLGSHEVKEHKEHEITAIVAGLALLFIFPAVLLSGMWFRRVA